MPFATQPASAAPDIVWQVPPVGAEHVWQMAQSVATVACVHVWWRHSPGPLVELQDRLVFTQERNWGYRLRQGLVEISADDMTTIAEAMFTASARPGQPAA